MAGGGRGPADGASLGAGAVQARRSNRPALCKRAHCKLAAINGVGWQGRRRVGSALASRRGAHLLRWQMENQPVVAAVQNCAALLRLPQQEPTPSCRVVSEPGPPNSKLAIAAALLSIQCCRAGLRRQGPLPRQAHARTMRLAGRTAGLLAALAALACFTGGATAMGRECWQLGGGGGGLYQPPPLPRSHRLPCSCWPRSSPTLV